MLQQPLTPIIVEAIGKPAQQTSILDLLLGIFAVVGGLVGLALAAGLAFAGLLIGLRRVWPSNPINGTGGDRTRLGLDVIPEIPRSRDADVM